MLINKISRKSWGNNYSCKKSKKLRFNPCKKKKKKKMLTSYMVCHIIALTGTWLIFCFVKYLTIWIQFSPCGWKNVESQKSTQISNLMYFQCLKFKLIYLIKQTESYRIFAISELFNTFINHLQKQKKQLQGDKVWWWCSFIQSNKNKSSWTAEEMKW